jgi:hypothetical protein
MTYQPGESLLNKYRIEALIGQGAFGESIIKNQLATSAPFPSPQTGNGSRIRFPG